MSTNDETKRKVLADKHPQMEQHFQEIKKQAYEPQIERLGQTDKEQNQRTQ
ncbi:hypothetical protein [Desulfosporosinus sp. Sb-LF]|uniref:hypothetical protein n=1 Tax=Desulfosporosinus sp. Sb-LF TaxID=2560027 RepID=UPI0018EE822F|nr:hypothetical protein [Desulfosporosinus sp. Sb-LF]